MSLVVLLSAVPGSLPVMATTQSSAITPAVRHAMQIANETMGDAIVSPAMDQFVVSTSRLKSLASQVESLPSEQNLSSFKEQYSDVIENREMLRAYEFGPAHSLGYAVALDTPTDTAGISALLADEQLFAQLTASGGHLLQSLQGLSAIEFVLENWQSSDMPTDFNRRQRQFLVDLSDRIFNTALAMQQVWFDTQQDNPAFNSLLVTAGTPGNASYQTIESASEEWVRGSVNALAALLEEGLIDAADSLDNPDSHAAQRSLHGIRGLLSGVAMGYSGPLFREDIGEHEIDGAVRLTASTASKVSTSDQGVEPHNSGISYWVSIQNPVTDADIGSALVTALNMTDAMLDSSTVNSDGTEFVEGLTGQVEEVVQLLESQVLPLTLPVIAAE